MSKVLVIGCGGVASVAIRKCCQVSEVFSELCIASRTKSKCDELAADLEGKTETKITTAQVDADDVDQVIALIKEYQPDGLHSHNPRYKTIFTGEGVDVRCCGRVTGAVADGDIATGSLMEKIEAAFDEEDE